MQNLQVESWQKSSRLWELDEVTHDLKCHSLRGHSWDTEWTNRTAMEELTELLRSSNNFQKSDRWTGISYLLLITFMQTIVIRNVWLLILAETLFAFNIFSFINKHKIHVS